MNKIDFYQRKVDLHKDIVQAIKDVMEEHNVSEVDLSEGCDKAYVVIADTSIEDMEVKKVVNRQGVLFITSGTLGYEGEWNIEATGDSLLCAISDVYDSVFEKLNNN